MTLPLKPRVAKKIAYIDSETKSVTAGQANPFENIPASIEGDGSEVYDYTMYVRLDTLGEIRMTCENLVSYSEDYMQGRSTLPDADVTASQAYIKVCECQNVTYPSLAEIKVTGYTGNKRHISVFHTYHDGATVIQKTSYYTADTATELKSFQFYSPVDDTLTYSIVGHAVPKLQYNPHAIRLDSFTMTNQTADIVYGGVNDTRGVDDLDGDEFDYYIQSNLDTSQSVTISGYINEVLTANKTRQRCRNNNGTIESNNSTTQSPNFYVHTGDVYISAVTGRKKLSTQNYNRAIGSVFQSLEYYLDPDTSTPMTSLLLRPSASVSGNIQLYAVPKGMNADLTPWEFKQTIDINGDFSAGHSFDIPDWAMFMKVDFVGEGNGSNILIDFNNLGLTIDRQYLLSNSGATTALLQSNNDTIANANLMSKFKTVCSLKNGSNRPLLSQSFSFETLIFTQGSFIKDSSTVFTTTQIKASNSNIINGKLTVLFI